MTHAKTLLGAMAAASLLTAAAAQAHQTTTQTQGSTMSSERGEAGERPRSETPPPSRETRHETAQEPREQLGEKTWKERINTVARRPLEHDLEMIDTTDRDAWHGYTIWRGIRDRRPLIARKTLGFKDRDPGPTRRERVLLISRGPIRGPIVID